MGIFARVRQAFGGPGGGYSSGRHMVGPRAEGVPFSLNDPRFLEYMRSGGASVSVDEALRNEDVYRCLSLICGIIGMLPLEIKKLDTDGKMAVDTKHPLYRLFRFKPNSWQTPYEFKSLMQFRALVHGSAYARVVRSSGNRILMLVPIDNSRVLVKQRSDWSVYYEVRTGNGITEIASEDMFRLQPGLSMDGITAISTLERAADALTLARDARLAMSSLFSSGMQASGALKMTGHLSDEALDRLKTQLNDEYSGARNRGKWLVLEDGSDASLFSQTASDSQLNETRNRQTEAVARVFGVPRPFMGLDDTSWGSGIEQLVIMFRTAGLAPNFAAWEEAIMRSCIQESEWGHVIADFDERDLTRGSMKDQAEYFAKALGSGGHMPWMEADEVRESLGLGKHKDGSGLVMPGQANNTGGTP